MLPENNAWKVSKYAGFLVRIFLHSDWIRRSVSPKYVVSPKTGKYGPEKSVSGHFHVVKYNRTVSFWLILHL